MADNPGLQPFLNQAKARHPRLHRMTDILAYEYAVILLTESEFNGALCQPPEFGENPFLKASQRPAWLNSGSEVTETGYAPFWYCEGGKITAQAYREHYWAKDHMPCHIGGTMRPVQATPRFSPFYTGFTEGFGGYNFGGGSAQLDFLEMAFDWACG